MTASSYIVVISVSYLTLTSCLLAEVLDRRSLLGSLPTALVSSSVLVGSLGEAPPLCSELTEPTPGCLGAVDGLLADCAMSKNCVASQDDTPGVFSPPWQIEGSVKDPLDRIILACSSRKDYVRVVQYDTNAQYCRVLFRDRGGFSDVEFLKTVGDDTIQFRAASRGGGGANQKKRVDELRLSLGFTEIPVLRNRRRAFVVVESPLDSFGPSSTRDPTLEEEKNAYRDVDPLSTAWQPGGEYANGSRLKSEFLRFLNQERDDHVRSK